MGSRDHIEFSILDFKSKFSGHLNSDNIEQSVIEYEKIVTELEKVSAYAFLQLQTNIRDLEAVQYYQKTTEWIAQMQAHLVFFEVELLEIDLKSAESALQNSKYLSWIRDCFRFKPHVLSNDEERILAIKQTTSLNSWIRLYDEILAHSEFEFQNKKVNLSEIVEIANHSDNEEEREQASRSLSEGLNHVSFYITSVYNNIVLDWATNNQLRHYSYPEEPRHISNNIDKESVDFLYEAVTKGYQKTAHKYYKIKARLLNKSKLSYWDRNAAIKRSDFLNKTFSYQEAVDIVLSSYADFSPEFADIGLKFIKNRWIDVMPAPGKVSGAFSHSTSVEVHPYILLNFFGKTRDISTLAHELGHGIHQVLASKNGTLLSNTPITLSEVASLFGEKIVFETLMKNTSSNDEKIDLLCSKLDDTMNSVVRQIAFFEFEKKVHNVRKNNELSTEDISKIWIDTQTRCLGEHVHIDNCISNYWCYISHFFHSPFYVYAYAFGEILVNALYNTYLSSDNKSDFVPKYTNMLSNGGIEKYDQATSRFGLNTTSIDFWINGVNIISQQVDELENLCGSFVC